MTGPTIYSARRRLRARAFRVMEVDAFWAFRADSDTAKSAGTTMPRCAASEWGDALAGANTRDGLVSSPQGCEPRRIR